MALPITPHNWAVATTGMAMLATGWRKWVRFTRTGPTTIQEARSPAGEGEADRPQLNLGDRRLLLLVLSHVEAANVPFLARVTGLSAETVGHHLSLLAEAGCFRTLAHHAACAMSPTATLTEMGLQHLRSLDHP